ncbi:MAG TPA: hypothetical protein VFQ95_06655 [Rhodanobacteraceae bacterium]|nr:hypothetical protein [Rhodanobacteraceae bacterium]
MNDTDVIQAAYADALHRLFAVFLEGLAAAGGDADRQTQAAATFKSGLVLARMARDQAMKMVRLA